MKGIKLLKNQNKFPRNLYNKDKWLNTFNALNLLKEGNKVLNVGCGPLKLSNLKKFEVYGIDIDKKTISLLDKDRYKVADVNKNIPFEDNLFDGVMMLEVIEHLDKSDKALSEIKRVLKKDGILILSTPNYNSLMWKFVENVYAYVFGFNIKEVHINMYNSKRLKKQLKKYFKYVYVKKMSHNMGLFAISSNVEFNLGKFFPISKNI